MAEKNKKTNSKSGAKSGAKSDKSKKDTKQAAKKEPEKEPEKPKKEKISMPAAPAPPEEKKEEPEKKDLPEQVYSVCLFSAGILSLLLIFVQGSAMWKVMHEAFKGFFGFPVILIPAGLFWSAYQVDQKKEKQKLRKHLKWLGISIVFFCCLIEIMFFGGRILDYGFFGCLKLLRQEGIAWRGGGMVGALSYPIQALFGVVGSRILICLMLFVSIMLLTKKTLSELFDMMKSPFRRFGDWVREDRAEARTLEEYDQEQEENNLEALAIAEEGSRKQIPIQPEFSIDIPMSSETVKQDKKGMSEFFEAPEKQTKSKVKLRKKSETKSPEEEEQGEQMELFPSLEDLIANAAETSVKQKKKEAQMKAAMQEISNEINTESVPDVYQMPRLEFLRSSESHGDVETLEKELLEKAEQLKEVLGSFKVEVEIKGISRGPSVTRYEVRPAFGVKVSRITSLSDDIALNLAAQGVRIEAPVPGKSAVGIEVPNSQKDTVSLRELLESPEFQKSRSKLTFGVGKDIAGNVIIGDIAKMPHMIIAGATGSGKSVCTNSIIMSILYHAAPDEVKLILIDPKIVEFRVYDGIPHLLIPVVTDPKKAAGALNWAVQEMLRRYDIFASNSVRNLEDYNRICEEKPELGLQKMPQIVICIDELADLMMTASKEVEEAICRLAQLARAAGMHLIIATQRPTTDIITGLIKANIPSRIALSVMSQIDSRIILDCGGAEKLLGHGDMLYLPNGQPKPVRVQGCYVSTQEIETVVEFIKNQSAETEYDQEIQNAVEQMAVTGDKKKNNSADDVPSGDGDLIEQAIEVVVSAGQASTSYLQRRLKLGYARAARIMDELEAMGVVGASEGAKPRRVLMSPLQLEERRMHRKEE